MLEEDWISPEAEKLLEIRERELRSHLARDNSRANPGLASYLRSKRWRFLSGLARKRDRNTCQVTGCDNSRELVVHHIRYPINLGDEPLLWIITLCKAHHYKIHFAAPLHCGYRIEDATWAVLGYEINLDALREGQTPREEDDGKEIISQEYGSASEDQAWTPPGDLGEMSRLRFDGKPGSPWQTEEDRVDPVER